LARLRVRIHLSTAIILMLVAGLLLWLNFRQGFEIEVIGGGTWSHETYGFPLSIWHGEVVNRGWRYPMAKFNWARLVLDMAFALATLLIVGVFIEYFFGRRSAKPLKLPNS